ncbi:MAG: hypothetical protein MUF49_30990 [Oculatellaceae cyanobacterium Prado106]|jgi:hypothetical protein|nr:hypothetical protein [Oculatellaceae cyanobacterium Prado106]
MQYTVKDAIAASSPFEGRAAEANSGLGYVGESSDELGMPWWNDRGNGQGSGGVGRSLSRTDLF